MPRLEPTLQSRQNFAVATERNLLENGAEMDVPGWPNVLSLEGEIDLHISPSIAASLAQMVASHPARLVVDLSRVTYIDSSGLAVLIEAMQNVEEYGGKLTLAGMNENVLSIFEMARLDQFFLIFPHVDAAMAAT